MVVFPARWQVTPYSLQQFLKFICYKLYFWSDNNLNRGLAWTDYSAYACRFNLLFIDCCIVFDFQTKSGNTVIYAGNVLFTAQTFQNNGCHGGKVVICQNDLGLILTVVFTSRSLQIKCFDSKAEYDVEYDSCTAIPNGIISQVFCAAGSWELNTRSVKPAEKEKPARNPTVKVMKVKIPYSNA